MGRPLEVRLVPVGGRGGYAWEVPRLPQGLRFSSTTGRLSGVPAASGTFSIPVTLRDGEGRAARLDLRLAVARKLSLLPIEVRPARVGVPFRVALRTVGGVGPVTWRLLRVRPVSRVRLDRSSGALSFTPRVARRIAVTVRVADRLGAVSTRTYAVVATA